MAQFSGMICLQILLWWLGAVSGVLSSNDSWTPSVAVNLGEAAELGDMQGILNWAIENSDPEELRTSAQAVNGSEGKNEVQEEHVKELLRLMSQQPTEADLLKEALELLQALNASDDQISGALTAIKLLVESIDNANDMKALGGIEPVVLLLERGPPFDGQAAYVLGTAAANNPTFQNHLIEAFPDILDKLIAMTSSKVDESVSKAVYALSSIVRNLPDVRTTFYAKGGLLALHKVLARNPILPNLERKCLGLLADLVTLDNVKIQDKDLLEVIVSKVDHDDLDIMEKALKLLILMQQSSANDSLLKTIDLDARISPMKARLEHDLSEEPDNVYLSELLILINRLCDEPAQTHNEL